MRRLSILLIAGVAACSESTTPPPRDSGVMKDAGTRDSGRRDAGPRDAGDRDGGGEPDGGVLGDGGLTVVVTLDGEPIAGAVVKQGGAERSWITGADGTVAVELDPDAYGRQGVVASHPDARMRGAELFGPTEVITIALERFDRTDNENYVLGDPGEPTRRLTTAQCAHCHVTINEDWFESPHRQAARNPTVHDLYAGTTAAANEPDCTSSGGRWREGIVPGTGAAGMRCYLGEAALEAVNAGCNETPCESTATAYGECANCHAPAIDGVVGGRDLLEATGLAYDYGVSCDTCHKIEDVVLSDPPGVGGRLRMLRPSEPASLGLGGGGFLPLTFGPSIDSPNPRMGGVPREHFRDATLCAGCHEHETAALRVGDTVDMTRWPSGRIPIQSTYAEWLAGPMSPSTPCQECHMPPAPERMNAADLQILDDAVIGISGGWRRPPGAVRKHSWYGPRQPESRMLEMAAAVFVDKTVNGGMLDASVTVKNVGAGHAIPTGEPMRTIVLSVTARCQNTDLIAIGGDAIPDFGGRRESKASGEDWSIWTGARVGDVVRVVRRPGGHHDYVGPLSFGDGSRTPADRGLPIETVVGERTITAVGATVTFDGPLPAGDVAHLVRNEVGTAAMLAGAPGFAYARVLVGANGERRVPHFVAVDVASDNRLPPQGAFTTTHRFQTTCADPVVEARLLYRPYPHRLAEQRGWTNPDQVMTAVSK